MHVEAFSFNLVLFKKFGFQGYLSNWILAIVKQEILDWPGNNGKITSENNLELSSSEKNWDLDRGYLCQ